MRPQWRNAEKIATAFGVSSRWILEGEDPPSVIPVKTGIHSVNLDARLRGHDDMAGPQIREAPEPHGGLDKKDRAVLEEAERFFREEDEDIKKDFRRRLRDDIHLLRRAAKTAKKRVSGED